MDKPNSLFDVASAFFDIQKDKIKAISIIVEGKYGDITYNVNQNDPKMESESKINNLEKENEKLRNEVNDLKNMINFLEKKYEKGLSSVEKKYEDKHEKLQQLFENLDKKIDENKKSDTKQKENNDLKDKNQLIDDPKPKKDENKIPLKNPEETNNDSPKDNQKSFKTKNSFNNQKKAHNQTSNRNEHKKENPIKPNSSFSKNEKNDNVIKTVPQHSNVKETKITDEKKNEKNNRKITCSRGYSRDNKIGEFGKSNKETKEGINLSNNRKAELANKIIADYELEGVYSVEKVIKKIDELNTKEILDEDDLIETVGNKLSK